MDLNLIASKTDLTYLKFDNNIPNLRKLVSDGVKIKPASFCIYPNRINFVTSLPNYNKTPICTVINFPHGSSSIFSADTNITSSHNSNLKDIDYVLDYSQYCEDPQSPILLKNLKQISHTCKLNKLILKVIVETSITAYDSNPDTLKHLYDLCLEAGADFIKTSTGFGPRGASLKDIEVWSNHRSNTNTSLKIKASGGINSVDDAVNMINAGADRLGIGSAYTKIFKEIIDS